MFSLLIKVQEQLWSKGVAGVRVLTDDEVAKYKDCSAGNGAGTVFFPYSHLTGNANDTGFVAMNQNLTAQVDYSAVKYCSNPTF